MENLIKEVIDKTIYPVNRTADQVLGRTAYARVRDIPERPEPAIVMVPRAAVPEAVADTCKRSQFLYGDCGRRT